MGCEESLILQDFLRAFKIATEFGMWAFQTCWQVFRVQGTLPFCLQRVCHSGISLIPKKGW